MNNLPTYDDFLNEDNLNEGKTKKWKITYRVMGTNFDAEIPGKTKEDATKTILSMIRGGVVIEDIEEVKESVNEAKKLSVKEVSANIEELLTQSYGSGNEKALKDTISQLLNVIQRNEMDMLGESNLNEAKKPIDYYDMGGETDKSQFGKVPRLAKETRLVPDLKMGKEYILLDLGMGEWMSSWKYTGQNESELHVFVSTLQFNDQSLEYSTEELVEAIQDAEIYEQK